MGVVCSRPNEVLYQGPVSEPTPGLSPRNSQDRAGSIRRWRPKRVSWQIDGTSDENKRVLEIFLDASLLPLPEVSQKRGLEARLYKHPVIVVHITVLPLEKTKQHVLKSPCIDWGEATVVKQVPKELPSTIVPGSAVLHAILAKNSPVHVDIKLQGIIDQEKVEFWATVQQDVSYLSDPIIIADSLQVLQEQLQAEGQGGNCDNRRQNTARQRKGSFVFSEPKPRRLSTRKNRVEGMDCREEDEETEDDWIITNRTSRRLSRLSRLGRTSRIRRRCSYSSLGGDSVSSLVVNPSGIIRTKHSRSFSDRRCRRWSERCSVTEFRQRPGEMSDLESLAESDKLASVSSAGGIWSEYSGNGRRMSVELKTLDASLWENLQDDENKTEAGFRETPDDGRKTKSSLIQSGEEPYISRISPPDNVRQPAGHVRCNSGMKPVKQRRPTPMAAHHGTFRCLPLLTPVGAIVEEDIPEEAEAEAELGYMSDCMHNRRSTKKISLHNMRLLKSKKISPTPSCMSKVNEKFDKDKPPSDNPRDSMSDIKLPLTCEVENRKDQFDGKLEKVKVRPEGEK